MIGFMTFWSIVLGTMMLLTPPKKEYHTASGVGRDNEGDNDQAQT